MTQMKTDSTQMMSVAITHVPMPSMDSPGVSSDVSSSARNVEMRPVKATTGAP